jgi:DNA gyrase subunit A
MVYRMKVWRLPAATPQSLGKALVNLLPLSGGETITSILTLPEDTATWSALQLMFATRFGDVRRNSLADFENINRNGKIAMKLAEGDRIVRVSICNPSDNVLLTTAGGRCIRFPVGDVRVFKGRDSTGVRGIKLEPDDEVISLAILHHMEATPDERAAYLKQALGVRRAQSGDPAEMGPEPEAESEASTGIVELSPARYAELGAKEQFVLTVSERGFGKRTSSHEYRISSRGGKGIVAMIVNERNGRLVASFPIDDADQIMLVTDGGKLIRCPVDDVRIAARNTQGVRIFKTEESERVASVERISDDVSGAALAENGGDAADGEAGA